MMWELRESLEKTVKQAFRAWFNKKWGEWDAETGNRSTQQELADYLKISRSSVAQYTAGTKLPEGENLRRLAEGFKDFSVYDLLGVDRPRQAITIDQLPEELRDEFESAMSELRSRLESEGLDPSTDEGIREISSILSKYGFTITLKR